MSGATHIGASADVLGIEVLERVAAAVEQIDLEVIFGGLTMGSTACVDGSAALDPEQAFPGFTRPFGGNALSLGHGNANVENLVDQTKHLARVGVEGQAIVALVAFAGPITD